MHHQYNKVYFHFWWMAALRLSSWWHH